MTSPPLAADAEQMPNSFEEVLHELEVILGDWDQQGRSDTQRVAEAYRLATWAVANISTFRDAQRLKVATLESSLTSARLAREEALRERDEARELVEDVLEEYAEADAPGACDKCADCGGVVMCDFHSVLSSLSKRTWTTGKVLRALSDRIAAEQKARAIAAEAEARTLREALIEANEFTLVGISRGPAIPRWVQMRAKLEAALTPPSGDSK